MIKDVSNSTVLDLYGKQSKVSGFLSEVHDRHFNIKLSRGNSARMSIKHRQVRLTEHGLETVTADELRVGDWIPQNIGYYSNLMENFRFSEKAYFLGLWFGDGCRQQPEWRRSSQLIRVSETELLEFCDKSNAFRIKSLEPTEGLLRWTYTDEMTDYFKSIFPNYKYGPNNLHSLDIHELASFTKGWFDADGDSSYNLSQSDPTSSAKLKVTFFEKSIDVARLVGTFFTVNWD